MHLTLILRLTAPYTDSETDCALHKLWGKTCPSVVRRPTQNATFTVHNAFWRNGAVCWDEPKLREL